MNKRQYKFRDGVNGSALAIRVIPRAKRNEVAKVLNDGTIRIRIAAPPIDGKANQALIKFLAKILGVPKSKIEIVAGEKGRNKLVSIIGMDANTVQKKILEQMD